MTTETYTCPTCRHQSAIYQHGVGKGIVRALIKVGEAVKHKRSYSIHNRKDMDGYAWELSKNEYGNFTMLRYHGLVAHDDEAGKGYWILTRRGSEFLKGNLAIPSWVKVLNNEVQDEKSEVFVTITDVLSDVDTAAFVDIDHLQRERVPLELTQVGLFG